MSSTLQPPRNPRVARPHRPKDATTPGSWIVETGGGAGGGGGTGGGVPAPDVTIDPPAEVIFRGDHQVEVDLAWIAGATASPANFLGVAVYLEDPDISTGANHPLDGLSMPLDGSAQVSGDWAPVFVNDSSESPAIIFPNGPQSYKSARNIRIYLAAYGPYSHPDLRRATDPNPTPNILVEIPIGRGSGESGQEWAFLVTLPDDAVTVTTDYNRLDPKYYLTLKYNAPDPTIPVPPGVNRFGGCRIVFVYEDAGGNPLFPGTDTGMNIPVNQSSTGFKSDLYNFGNAGKFRVYFVSEDDSQPLGNHINSLTEGTTPYAYANVPAVPGTPDITSFSISDQKIIWLIDGSMSAEATFAWHLPDDPTRYAGVHLYLVKVAGSGTSLTPFPQDLSGAQANLETAYVMGVSKIPNVTEVWTIAAISYNKNGELADDPKAFGQPGFHSPTVTWTIGPPDPGSPGSGTEFAPLVTVNPGASVLANSSVSADGVGMVSFAIGSALNPAWTNPTDNRFNNVRIAMGINNDPTHVTYWTVPANTTYFTTPAMATFGNIGDTNIPVDFYLLSDDPQGNENSLRFGVTPVIRYLYTPKAGAIIPARSGWFDDSQFSWVDGSGLTADNIEANNIYVGKTLVVGGSNDTSFAGQANGQIAVKNSSGVLRAWMGEQQPNQGMSGAPLWGAWFGQTWIGGTSPLDAPLWVDNQGIIQVGGIAAAKGSRYPYLSVRDQTGLEMGRIGAQLNVPSGSVGDNVGQTPTQGALAQLTAGAWFTQLAVGGGDLSHWNVLIVPDTTPGKAGQSQFLMRNLTLLSIDYAASQVVPLSNEYKLEFGSSMWTTLGPSSYQFPGIHIYEIDGIGNAFGSIFLNRGMVLKGTQIQSYQVLASLVTYNGDQSGRDSPADHFWAELAMYSPLNQTNGPTSARTVYLTSGGPNQGNPQFILLDGTGALQFQVDVSGHTYIKGTLQGAPVGGTAQPVTAVAYNVVGRAVIDATGHWVGQPITTGSAQTPWTQPISGGNFPLTGASYISAGQYFVPTFPNAVIDVNGAFRGTGINVTTYGIGCGALSTMGGAQPNTPNGIDTAAINCSGNITANGGFFGGAFHGAGIDVGSNGIRCGALSTTGGAPQFANTIETKDLAASGNVSVSGFVTANSGYGGGAFRGAGVDVGTQGINCGFLSAPTISTGTLSATVVNLSKLQVNGTTYIDGAGTWTGNVNGFGFVYAADFGISGVAKGWPRNTSDQPVLGSFATGDGRRCYVQGGLIVNVV